MKVEGRTMKGAGGEHPTTNIQLRTSSGEGAKRKFNMRERRKRRTEWRAGGAKKGGRNEVAES